MNKYLLLYLMIFFSFIATACECDIIDMRTYDYIALIKIESVEICNEASNDYNWLKYEVNVETLESFVGEEDICIEVSGGSCQGMIATSCDLCLDVGEEWIISGRYINGVVLTHYCSLHQLYRSANYQAPLKERGVKLLDRLCSWKSSM